MRARMGSADDCFARFERGAIPRAGSIGQDLARGPSWGQGEGALLMSPTFPEGIEVRIGPAWERRHAGPSDGAPPSRAHVRC